MAEECSLAFQAALELIEEKCGSRLIPLDEASLIVKVSEEVEKTASSNPELTREERISVIEEMAWTQGWAGGMCRLVSPELTGEKREACIARLARKLAERVV